MLALLALIPNWLKFAACGLVGAALLAAGSYTLGRHDGRQQAAEAATRAVAQAYKDRTDEDTTVDALDPVHLCIALGGVRDTCITELRGLGEDQAPAADGGLPRRP